MVFDDCSRIRRKISACLDGELAPVELAEVKAHAEACPGCGLELRLLAAVDSGIKQLPAVEPAPFFAARVTAAARALGQNAASLAALRARGLCGGTGIALRRFLRIPVPAMALLVSFILVNLSTFAFNINAMESGPRRELARKIVAQLAKPASIINPVALARLCGECSKYMCLCLHEAGKKSLCPCKDCEMERQAAGKNGIMKDMEKKSNVR